MSGRLAALQFDGLPVSPCLSHPGSLQPWSASPSDLVPLVSRREGSVKDWVDWNQCLHVAPPSLELLFFCLFIFYMSCSWRQEKEKQEVHTLESKEKNENKYNVKKKKSKWQQEEADETRTCLWRIGELNQDGRVKIQEVSWVMMAWFRSRVDDRALASGDRSWTLGST